MPNALAGTFVAAIAVAILALPAVHAQGGRSGQGNDLFQKALSKERVEGQLQQALDIYDRIVREFASDRALAAKALLQMGRCYERLGKTDAKPTYDRLLREFGDQRAVIDEARARLAALTQLSDKAARRTEPLSPQTRQLWRGNAAGQSLGSPSPDGRYISFVDWSTLELGLWDMATHTQRLLTKDLAQTDATPYWSRIAPDGEQVVFTTFSAAQPSDLRLVRLDNPTVKVVYRNAEVDYIQPFDWSRDSRRVLVVLAMPDRTHRIGIITIADGSVRVLKTLDWRQPRAMNFSPDGRWIVYDLPQQDSGPERDLFVLAADGTRETPLVEHPADDFLLGWAPEGNTVLFASDRTGVPAAWALQVVEGKPSGPPRFIRGDLGWRVHPMGFTRTGAFVYFVASAISDLYTASLDSTSGSIDDTMTAVGGRYAGTYESADWSPDGRELALTVNRAGMASTRLVVRLVERDEARELGPDLSMFKWPRWAPDGRSILVSGEDQKGRKGFFRIDPVTGRVEALVREEPGALLALRAEWAPDGQSIYYVRRDARCSCILKRDIASGRDTEIEQMTPRSTLVLIAPSPDGRWIAVSTRDENRTLLKVIPAEGGQSRVLAEGDTLKWFNFVTWTPDARDVLFGRDTGVDQRVDVWRVAVAGGDPRRTGLSMDSLRDLRVHPDGRRVIFASGQNKGELWVMENFLHPTAATIRSRKSSR